MKRPRLNRQLVIKGSSTTDRTPDYRMPPVERDPLAGHTCLLNKLSPGGTEHGSHESLKGNERLSSCCSAHLIRKLLLYTSLLPSSPAELRLRKAKILIKPVQKVENAWNKVTVTVKCPEMPIRNCNTGVLLQLTPP